MLVREVMTRRPVGIGPDASTKEALRRLDEHDITAMPVVRSGRLVGVVSEADLLRGGLPHDARAHMVPAADRETAPGTVADVMTGRPVTVQPDTDLADALRLMTAAAVKSVPVVDASHHVVGMLSRRDVVHLLARPDDRIAADLNGLCRALGVDWRVEVADGVVAIEGPVGGNERSLAHTAAATVPGVRGVTVRGPRAPRRADDAASAAAGCG